MSRERKNFSDRQKNGKNQESSKPSFDKKSPRYIHPKERWRKNF
jgi:hypothetical protein